MRLSVTSICDALILGSNGREGRYSASPPRRSDPKVLRETTTQGEGRRTIPAAWLGYSFRVSIYYKRPTYRDYHCHFGHIVNVRDSNSSRRGSQRLDTNHFAAEMASPHSVRLRCAFTGVHIAKRRRNGAGYVVFVDLDDVRHSYPPPIARHRRRGASAYI